MLALALMLAGEPLTQVFFFWDSLQYALLDMQVNESTTF
jgi:hypothetical protein